MTNGPLRGYIITVNWSRADSGSRLDNTQTKMFSVGTDVSEVSVFVPEGYQIGKVLVAVMFSKNVLCVMFFE